MIIGMAHVQEAGSAQVLFNGSNTGERADRAWPPFKADALFCEPEGNPCRISFRDGGLDGTLSVLHVEGHPSLDCHEDAGQGKSGPVMVPETGMIEPWLPVAPRTAR